MNTILERTAALLQRRFVLNAFLPLLIVVSAAVVLYLYGAGRLDRAVQAWSLQSGTVQLMLVSGWLATIWITATFFATQFRNITRFFEGYPLRQYPRLAWLDRHFSRLHYQRRELMLHQDGAAEAKRRYPTEPDDFLPTRLGNVLRAAEFYPSARYGMDLLFAWPRLAHVLPDRYRSDVGEFRTDYEWLLAVAFLMAGSASILGVALFFLQAPWWLFLIVVSSGWGSAFVSYRTAVTAAAAFGDQLRAGVDLYRTDLLVALRLGVPSDNRHERRLWDRAVRFHLEDARQTYPYADYRPASPDDRAAP